MPRIEKQLIELPIIQKLPIPATEADRSECLRLLTTLRSMEVTRSHFGEFMNRPAAFVCYRGGRAPEPCWSKWLWGKIIPACSEFTWLGRLAGINPYEHELVFIPRPGMIDESMAQQAKENTTDNQLLRLVMGIVYPPHQYMRPFPQLH